jgi:hypothetical protein
MSSALDIPLTRLRDLAYRSGVQAPFSVAGGVQRERSDEHWHDDGIRTKAPNLVLDSPTKILRRRLMGSPQAVSQARQQHARQQPASTTHTHTHTHTPPRQTGRYVLPWSPEHPNNRLASKYDSPPPCERQSESPGRLHAARIRDVRRSLHAAEPRARAPACEFYRDEAPLRAAWREQHQDGREEAYKGPAHWPRARNHHHHEGLYDRAIAAASSSAGVRQRKCVHDSWLDRSRKKELGVYKQLYEQQRGARRQRAPSHAHARTHTYTYTPPRRPLPSSSSSPQAAMAPLASDASVLSVAGIVDAGLIMSPTPTKQPVRHEEKATPSCVRPDQASRPTTKPHVMSLGSPFSSSSSSSAAAAAAAVPRGDSGRSPSPSNAVAAALTLLQWNLEHAQAALVAHDAAPLDARGPAERDQLAHTIGLCQQMLQGALARVEGREGGYVHTPDRPRRPAIHTAPSRSVRKRVDFAMKTSFAIPPGSSSD